MDPRAFPLHAEANGRQPIPQQQQQQNQFLSSGGHRGLSNSRIQSLITPLTSHLSRLKSPIVVHPQPIRPFSVAVSSNRRKQRQPWSKQEDARLLEILKDQEQTNTPEWTMIAAELNPLRTGKQCRERWQNHLRPDIKKGNWTVKEEQMIESMYNAFGPKWSSMSKLLTNRTDNDIKNKWNSMVRTRRAKAKRDQQATNENSELQPPLAPFGRQATDQSKKQRFVLEDNQNVDPVSVSFKMASGKHLAARAAAWQGTHPCDSIKRPDGASSQNLTDKASYHVKQECAIRGGHGYSQQRHADNLDVGTVQSHEGDTVAV